MHRSHRCAFAVAISTLVLPMNGVAVHAQDATPPAAPSSSSTSSIPESKPITRSHRAHSHRTIHHRSHFRHEEQSEVPSGLNGSSPSADSTDRLARLVRLDDGERVWTPSREMLGVSYATGESDQSEPGSFTFTVDTDKLQKYLTRLKPYVDRSAHHARPELLGSGDASDVSDQVPAKILPARPAQSLDVTSAVDKISKAIESDPTTTHLDLPLISKGSSPQSASDLSDIDARIGFFVTHFDPGDVGRTETVRRAISLIDGTVVPPGGTFSINKTVGERTAERGFGMGHVFIDGKMEKQLGGGMCQVATTLFNACMLANLKIVERHQHVRTVPYVSPGRDATVYWGSKDFKFQNDTQSPIYISYKTSYTHAIVSLYGKAVPGRTVRLISHYRRLAERHYTGVFYRVAKYADGHVEKSDPYYSDYVWTPALDFSH